MATDEGEGEGEGEGEDQGEAGTRSSSKRKRVSGTDADESGAGSSARDSDHKKRELITMGKAKGFLTYDEVNEHMPDSIVSSDQMDDWLTAFSGEGIEVVDASSKLKVRQKAHAQPDDEDELEPESDTDDAPDPYDLRMLALLRSLVT